MVSKQVGGRGRQTESIPVVPTNCHLQSPISYFPFVLLTCLLHTCSRGRSFGAEDRIQDCRAVVGQTSPIRNTQVITAASIAVAALHFPHS